MGTRLQSARRRVRFARFVFGGIAAVLFGASMALARVHFPGHHKQGVTPLAPPGDFVQVVQRDQLQAGILAPAQAAPGIASAPS